VQQVQSSGGVFDVKLDGDLVFSKKRMGRHAEPGEVLRLIRERVG
jgi:selenoprotein W-related protein